MCAFAHENQIIAQQKPMSSEKDFNFAGKTAFSGTKRLRKRTRGRPPHWEKQARCYSRQARLAAVGSP
jgi:hypothetical protein